MGAFASPVINNVLLITGIINIVAILFLLFTCRFIPGLSLTHRLMNKSWFKPLYKYHAYIWWLLVPSVVVHAVIAISRYIAMLHHLPGG
jgi:hypothetical protein